MNLSDYSNLSSYPKVLLYGAPFTGKTTAAAMLSKYRKIQLIDLDRNAGELIHSIPKEYHENIDIVPMPDSIENPVFDLLLDFLSGKAMDYNPIDGKKMSVKYRNVVSNVQPKLPTPASLEDSTIIVIDSGTTITESCLNYVRSIRNRSASEEKLDELQMSERDWGLVMGYLGKLTKVMKAIPYPIILICHEMIVELPDKSTRIAPALGSRNTSRNLAKDFTAVVHMSLDGTLFKQISSQKSNSKVVVGSRRNVFLEEGKKLIDFFNGSSNFVDGSIANVTVNETPKDILGKPDTSFFKK